MTIAKNDVVSILTVVGEFIGKFKEEDENEYTVEDARMLASNENGLGLTPQVTMTGEPLSGITSFNKSVVVTVVPTVKEFAAEYRRTVSNLILPG